MADNQSTELALSSDNFSGEQQEQKSGFIGSLGGVDLVRQITMIVALTICLAIAILIILWAREPELRPLGRFQTMQVEELDELKDQELVLYCRSGNRSGQACLILDTLGFKNTNNLTGGMLAWQEKYGNKKPQN